MRNLPVFMFSLLLVGGLSSCQKEDVGLTDDQILETNKADILSYAAAKGLTGSISSTGVYYALSKPSGSGVTPAYGQEAEFSYKLSVLTRNSANAVIDTFVDSTYATKSSYVYLVANTPGLTEGILKMSEGDQSVILLPSVYAFGRTGAGNGIIPANAPVRLDMKLKRTRTEDQQIDEYLTANKLTPTEVTPSGLRFIKTLANSTGAPTTPTQTLTIKYRGQLLRATSAFDSTGTGTYSAVASQFVPGFAEGLAKLKVGEKATIVFPSKIGYGSTGYQVIPAYAPLRFDIELVSAQ
ncbi:FKBP-type peptidylprolyl isomerase [Spirosoma sp. KCTC 42546]|uniref:FKBP-type peptidyl-prolyl cis-trans isomerase n=1 Tax=Spirosoma sp. KCTC 42546 TaxID=2520506 RepID=UPI00115844F2|nr:FKBP-type peptidyl-prolyl cis-trans isomerase [Spirosoma sp. KCTC 42546]QDK78052.1 FKBP-type peptidylprolyl isomerase [Spirosoma sp. KCTC 42546]